MGKTAKTECLFGQEAPLSSFQRVLLAVIRGYQLTLSPFIGRQCRFYPTCSHYAQEAIHIHGAMRGSALAAKRLGKCHPFHEGGVDLVPPGQIQPETEATSTKNNTHTSVTSGVVSTHS